MTVTGPVERVASFLETNGFRQLPTPLVINQIKFDFPAVLDGKGKTSDLILVVDTAVTEDKAIVRSVLGVARALDIARANNSITTVVVGPRPQREYLDDLKSVSRVLPIGSVTDEPDKGKLSNWLAVLMPLGETNTAETIQDPQVTLQKQITDLPDELKALATRARHGSASVEASVRKLVENALKPVWEDLS